MFAADLPKRPIPESPASSVLLTPKEERDHSLLDVVKVEESTVGIKVEEDSPLKVKGKRSSDFLQIRHHVRQTRAKVCNETQAKDELSYMY